MTKARHYVVLRESETSKTIGVVVGKRFKKTHQVKILGTTFGNKTVLSEANYNILTTKAEEKRLCI